jgi:hypothetical protein
LGDGRCVEVQCFEIAGGFEFFLFCVGKDGGDFSGGFGAFLGNSFGAPLSVTSFLGLR